jgi:hypothetical protein
VESEPNVHFEPVVHLPEVETKTGEEDEDVVFSERAKLYRLDNKQWKERGVGNMKILRHKHTGNPAFGDFEEEAITLNHP